VNSAEECLRAVHEAPPDVILLDLGLEGVSGSELFTRLQANRSTAAIPVIVVSSQRLSDADRERFGSDFILPKSELTRERLHGYLRRARDTREAASDRVETRG
jgi:CheY-like chemotaxis protein